MIKGPIFATLTPFDLSGEIDKGALQDYLQFLYDRGVRSLVVGGTTGEFSSLDLQERTDLFRWSRHYFSGQIINNISSCSFKETRELVQRSDGADAILMLPPYYFNGVPDEGVIAFVKETISDISIPSFLYHFPRHTNFSFTVETVKRICDICPNVIGVKDSGGNFDLSLEFQTVSEDFQVFVGSDFSALKALKSGLSGSVSGASNPFPEYLVRLADAWKCGKHDEAITIQKNFDEWNNLRAQFKTEEIAMAKYALSLRLPGFPISMRAPFVDFSDLHKNKLQEFVAQNSFLKMSH